MIERIIEQKIKEKLKENKAIIFLGARQTGKTTILKKMFAGISEALWLNADEPDVQAMFETASSSRLKAIFENYRYIVIDEAQRLKNVGIKLKLITDELKEKKVIATGSSAFELANEINEPLTGRKWEYKLFTLSFEEMAKHHGILEEERLLQHRLIFGSYPEVIIKPGNERGVLKHL